MNKLIKTIIENKTRIIIVSPHLDDAVFSAGDLISFLSSNTEVVVVNVFTTYGTSNTLSAKAFLKQCGYKTAGELFSQRIKEDKEVFSRIGINPINLGFTDALWRQKQNTPKLISMIGNLFPEVVNIYPTYRYHIDRRSVSSHDQSTIATISKQLRNIVGTRLYNTLFICPLGITHVDHLVVRYSVEQITNPIYWLDQPYASRNPDSYNHIKEISQDFKKIDFVSNKKLKLSLLRGYESQFKLLYPEETKPELDETIFVRKELL